MLPVLSPIRFEIRYCRRWRVVGSLDSSRRGAAVSTPVKTQYSTNFQNLLVPCNKHIIFFFLMIQRPPISTLFPYTTLCRGICERIVEQHDATGILARR